MGCGNYKYSDTCGQSIFATCVNVEQTFPSISSLNSETCTDLDSVIEDLYSIVSESYVDMSLYDKGCLDFSPTADENITPVQVLNKLTTTLCSLQTTVNSIDTVDIANLDYTCLGPVDPCGEPISVTNLEDLLQLMIDKICALWVVKHVKK